jgi:hypothetical protein
MVPFSQNGFGFMRHLDTTPQHSQNVELLQTPPEAGLQLA